MVESAVGKRITYNTGLPTGRVQFDITGDPGEALSNTTIATITVAISDTVGSNKGGNCAGIHQSGSAGDGICSEGKIVDTEGSDNAITTPINILASNSFVAYLNLDGRLASSVADKTVIGNVTVTVTE